MHRLLLFIALTTASCGLTAPDSCVTTQTFEGQSSPQSYSCDEGGAEEYCTDYDDVNVEGYDFHIDATWHSGQACEDVGYPYECGYEWLSNASCDGSLPPGAGGSGGGSGGGGSCGSSSYGGPYYDDYQVESQCEALYAYGCSAEAKAAICEILDQWESNGVPNVCPYC